MLATETPSSMKQYPLPERSLIAFSSSDHRYLQRKRRRSANWTEASTRVPLINLLQPLPNADAITQCRAEVRRTQMEVGVQNYLVQIVRRTREHPSIAYGASPRASVALLLCAKALAAMRGREFATPDDVRDIARPVLRHRIRLRAEPNSTSHQRRRHYDI